MEIVNPELLVKTNLPVSASIEATISTLPARAVLIPCIKSVTVASRERSTVIPLIVESEAVCIFPLLISTVTIIWLKPVATTPVCSVLAFICATLSLALTEVEL